MIKIVIAVRMKINFHIITSYYRTNVKFETQVVNFTRRQSDEAFMDLCQILTRTTFSS